jgi:hypothetical protein
LSPAWTVPCLRRWSSATAHAVLAVLANNEWVYTHAPGLASSSVKTRCRIASLGWWKA